MTSYDLESAEQLYTFNSDCLEACCGCPNYNPNNPIDYYGGKNEVSPYEIFTWWKEIPLLWSLGYSVDLTEEAKATFTRYVMIPQFGETGIECDPKILDTETGKYLSDVIGPIFKFTS